MTPPAELTCNSTVIKEKKTLLYSPTILTFFFAGIGYFDLFLSLLFVFVSYFVCHVIDHTDKLLYVFVKILI